MHRSKQYELPSCFLTPITRYSDGHHTFRRIFRRIRWRLTVGGFMDAVNSVTHLYDSEKTLHEILLEKPSDVYMIMEFGWVVFVTPS